MTVVSERGPGGMGHRSRPVGWAAARVRADV